ncbi:MULTISPECIES: class I SAM-dependent methyltransferase [Pseudonocardia]|uniref:class I SAM-dependent methyltransferase n=1 Tax=Pseudonocardia TaxID=1847 RepID=UPI00307EBE5E
MSTIPDLGTLGAAHRAVWASGDYPAVAAELIPGLGEVVVDTAAVGPGDRVLDIAAGTGNAAVPAALRGADVVAADLTPELLAVGARLAADRGAALEWVEADAQALPFPDAAFDVVLSCVGVMFAPFHERAAAELLRVCRPGGRIALLAWTPGGFVGGCSRRCARSCPPRRPGRLPRSAGATRRTSARCSGTVCGTCTPRSGPPGSRSPTPPPRSATGGSSATGRSSPRMPASPTPRNGPRSWTPRSSTT